MRFLFLCITIITMVSCQKPYGTVTTNDEKSEIIKTLFQEVSNENIAYLEAVFSDSLVFINPHEQTLNKVEFIAAVSGLLIYLKILVLTLLMEIHLVLKLRPQPMIMG